MTGREEDDVLSWLDRQKLTSKYWQVFAGLGVVAALDFFDFYIVGFLMAHLSPIWNLTYGQSGLILLSAGLGSIIGAIIFGGYADRFGRKPPIVGGAVLCGICSVGIALLPEGAWRMFALLRFGVGLGLAATITATTALIVEHTPTRHRTFIASISVAFTSLGPLIASLVISMLIETIGWRGVAALGAAPAFAALIVAAYVPESTRWLASRGLADRARRSASLMSNRRIEDVPQSVASPNMASQGSGSFMDLFAYPREFVLTVLIWLGVTTANYGIYLWGPTLLALQLNLTVAEAATNFAYVAMAGLVGKVLFSVLPQKLGRVRAGMIGGYGMMAVLLGIALFHGETIFGVSAFLLLLIGGAVFYDGVFANQAPYAAEVFPVSAAARGVGLAQASNGLGKILGPLSLALLAGTDNFVAPEATEAAMLPGFLFLASMALVVGLAFTFLGIETHLRPLSLGGDDDRDAQTPPVIAFGDKRSTSSQ